MIPAIRLFAAIGVLLGATPEPGLIAPSPSMAFDDPCNCTASPPTSGLLACQSVTGTFGCTSGVCDPAPTNCVVTGSVTTKSTCVAPPDVQLCVTSTITLCVPGANHTIPANNTPISCGSIHTVTINFCRNFYPLACGVPSGWWVQAITCTACPTE